MRPTEDKRRVLAPLFVAAAFAAALGASGSASAALKEGVTAPDFQADASLAGNSFTFKLSDALKKGPVVLYFFPAAFTLASTSSA